RLASQAAVQHSEQINVLLHQASAERDRAEKAFQDARSAVNTYLTLVSTDQELEAPELEPLRRRLLESARDYYLSFVDQGQQRTDLNEELAAAYLRLAQLDAILRVGDWVADVEHATSLLHERNSPAPFASPVIGLVSDLYRADLSIDRVLH